MAGKCLFAVQPRHQLLGRIYNKHRRNRRRTPLVSSTASPPAWDATILLKCEFFNPLAA